jgi:predicted O-methyltransferase YrrM
MKNIFEGCDQYIENLFSVEDEVLKKIITSIAEKNLPQQSVSSVQGKFLQVMATACNAKRILEVGTFAGYSTVWLARSLPEDGKLISLESEELHATLAKRNIDYAGLSSVVEIKTGKALDILQLMIKNNEPPFDLIFIDADKPPYVKYFEASLKLSRPGTIIIADNVIREGKVLNENSDDEKVQGVQRFNKMLAANKYVTSTVMQTIGSKEHDGMAIAVVK